MRQISEHVYGVLTFMGFLNGYIIANGDTLALVDTGMSAGFVTALERNLAGHGWSLDNVQHILITHEHPDHLGGLAALQDRINATTYAHRLGAPVIRGEAEATGPDPASLGIMGRFAQNMAQASTPARVDSLLNGDDHLDHILPGLRVIHLPGHAYGQVGYWLPDEGTLIGGDVMMRYPWGLTTPIRFVSPDWDAVRQSIRHVADMGVRNLCLGHGQPMQTDTAAQIAAFAGRLGV